MRSRRRGVASSVQVLQSVSSWFGDSVAKVDLGAVGDGGACADWAKPVGQRPINPHAGVFQTLTRTPSMHPRIAPTGPTRLAPPNDARLLLGSESTFLKMQAMQAVSAGARSFMGGYP